MVTVIRRLWVAAIVLAVGGRQAAAAEGTGVTADQVRTAIERGSRYLVREQKADGSWPERHLYANGLTPLCTLALLHCGYSPDDEPVRKALSRLEALTPTATYTASIQTMAFCKADPRKYMLQIIRNVHWLEGSQVKNGAQAGNTWAQLAPPTRNAKNESKNCYLRQFGQVGRWLSDCPRLRTLHCCGNLW